jgi:uncharacterized protein (TIGR03086 family)
MDLAELFRRSTLGYLAAVDQVGAADWTRPTPCTDWDVRTLLNHIVYEDRWMVPLMEGTTIAAVGDRFERDLLGDDPAGNARDAAKQAEAAVSATGALDRTVQLSFGPTPAAEYVWQILAEHLVHGWDLAAGIGADRRLDPEVVRACADWFSDREQQFRDAGAIGPRKPAGDAASEQDRLLTAYGRDPNWTAPG